MGDEKAPRKVRVVFYWVIVIVGGLIAIGVAIGAATGKLDVQISAVVAACVGVSMATVVALLQLDLTANIAEEQNKTSQRQNELSKQQIILARYQLFPVVWKEMCDIEMINTKDMNEEDWRHAIKVSNILELVAICYESGMVEQSVIKRAYRKSFMMLYENLEQCVDPPKDFKSGKELIRGVPAVGKLYRELDEEHQNRDAVPNQFEG